MEDPPFDGCYGFLFSDLSIIKQNRLKSKLSAA